jgi:4-amino-4-deoxy-L-arabinose transferase-like glycosyltransferase
MLHRLPTSSPLPDSVSPLPPKAVPQVGAPPATKSSDRSELSSRDPRLLLLLGLTAVLLVISWWREEGYQIADSVEYLERAHGIVLGHQLIDSQAIRSFGFSGLLVPLFALAKWFGLQDLVHVAHAAQVLQVLLALALVVVTARIGARLAGPSAGLAAAAVLGFNPIFLRWGVEPVSGIAAALFIALALERALGERRARDGAVVGLWLGLAFLMAYQTILVIGAIVGVLVLRDALRHRAYLGALCSGLLALVLLQCVLDRLYYGSFGISVWRYVLENFGTNASVLLEKLKLHRLARWVYNQSYGTGEQTVSYQEAVRIGDSPITSKLPPSWYFTHITQCLVWPALALTAVGFARALGRITWNGVLLTAVIVANVAIMSVKGSKEFRLWLPFLPMIAVLAGLGFATLAGPPKPGRSLRWALVTLLLAGVGVAGAIESWTTNTRRFGGFWRAMALVNDAAAQSLESRRAGWKPYREQQLAQGADPATLPEEVPHLRVAAAYHWSMFLRGSSLVELVKLPHHLDDWSIYTPEERQEDLDTLAGLDFFITHLPVLTLHHDLFAAVNHDFAVRGVFYDRVIYEGLGPIYVLGRRTGGPGELTFFDLDTQLSEQAFRERYDLHQDVRFEHLGTRGQREELQFLGWEYTPLPGDGYAWITYSWRGGPFEAPDFKIIDRLTSPDGHNAWQNNHHPAYGVHVTSSWGEGWNLREGYLVVPEADPYQPGERYRRMGGEYRRGDLIPASLWLDVARMNADDSEVQERMDVVDPLSGTPVRSLTPPGAFPTAQGYRLSLLDGMALVGSFFMPVHPRSRRPDDGHPVPTEEP